jgi:hypothetical protein
MACEKHVILVQWWLLPFGAENMYTARWLTSHQHTQWTERHMLSANQFFEGILVTTAMSVILPPLKPSAS